MPKQIHFKFYFIVLTTLVFTLKNAFSQKSDPKENKQKTLVLTAEHLGPVINETHKDVLATNNKSGFETGQVIKLEGVYHMFVNEMFDRQSIVLDEHRRCKLEPTIYNCAINSRQNAHQPKIRSLGNCCDF